jgi:hypothetical protein
MATPIPQLPAPLRSLIAPQAPLVWPKRQVVPPPWLTNLYSGPIVSRAQRQAVTLPKIGLELAALRGQQAAQIAPSPRFPLLASLIRNR